MELEHDFQIIEDMLRQYNILGAESLSFRDIVEKLMDGKLDQVYTMCKERIGQLMFGEILANKNAMIQIFLIVIIGILFSNVATIFQNTYLGEAGFFVTYMLLFGVVATNYFTIGSMAQEAVERLLNFMKVLIPTYSIAVTTAAGVTTATVMYQSFMMLIGLLEWVLTYVVFPFIHLYFILQMVNSMDVEPPLSKLAELIEKGIMVAGKTILAVMVGFQMIQGILLPAVDSMGSTALRKGLEAIPGFGKGAGMVVNTMLGSSVIIKNSIGIAGMIIILIVMLGPIVKLGLFSFAYRVLIAVLQPVLDGRTMGCLNGVATVGKLLLHIVITATTLFFLCMAIVAYSTNVNYYAA